MMDFQLGKIQESSFRDPSGFVFSKDGQIYRYVDQRFQKDYDYGVSHGIYQSLMEKDLLVSHEEVHFPGTDAYRLLRPQMISFVSYPYEWCFSQLKDAALLTLQIQKTALEQGMVLKDASAYNVQFRGSQAIFIDTLSLEILDPSKPWIAYRQFCQHFLGPLALMHYRDIRLAQLLKSFIDGIPLDLVSRLLPKKTYFSPGLLAHIHLHAKAQQKYSDRQTRPSSTNAFSQKSHLAMVDHLMSTVQKLNCRLSRSEWSHYYQETNYSEKTFLEKKQFVEKVSSKLNIKLAWDFGGNTGEFSRALGVPTVCFDLDPLCVEKNYRRLKEEKNLKITPLVLDLTNPSPSLGWKNLERDSLGKRGPVDLALALALIHHLAIANNIPLDQIADFLSEMTENLVIEWVPKEDSQVRRLLKSRKDIFDRYTQGEFEKVFSKRFEILEVQRLSEGERTLYWMKKR